MKKTLLISLLYVALLADASAGTAVVIKDPHHDPDAQRFQFSPVQKGQGFSPVQFSLITPAQFPPEDWDVGGLAINLFYGTSHNFKGLAIGGVANRMTGRTDGLLLAPVANVVNGDSTALQISLVNFTEQAFTGLQVGAVNVAAMGENAGAEAIQIGVLYNFADSVNGAQIAIINQANYVKGLQLGLINYASDMMGVQIGLINIIDSKDYPFVPLLNARF